MIFWLKFFVCLLTGHVYGMRGTGSYNEHGYQEACEGYCKRCDLDFDGWDTDDIVARRDNFAWRLRNLRDRA